MHIIKLEAENFKRIEAIAIPFPEGGGVFEIAGKNEQGKSSAIDAIWAALGGKEASPDQPLRAGSLRGSSAVDLGEYKVTREWKADGATRLIVTDASGGKVARPQEVLDGLFSRLAFDPMEFTRQTSSKQAETLRRITGLDFTALERKRAALAMQRTEATRAMKELEVSNTRLAGAEEVAEVSVKDLAAKLREAEQANNEVLSLRRRAKFSAERIDATKKEIAELEAELMVMKGTLETQESEHVQLFSSFPEIVDTTPLVDALDSAEETNRKARLYQESVETKSKWIQATAKAKGVIDQIDAIDQEQQDKLAAAQFPVDGLSFNGDLVTFNGVPFDQVSTSEKIRVSLAMSAALNPKLRLVVVKDGSLLDDDKLAIVAAWAAANSYQVLVERVAQSVHGVGVVIEEGRVKEPTAALATA